MSDVHVLDTAHRCLQIFIQDANLLLSELQTLNVGTHLGTVRRHILDGTLNGRYSVELVTVKALAITLVTSTAFRLLAFRLQVLPSLSFVTDRAEPLKRLLR